MKKIIGTLLVILMIFGLTSCKNKEPQKNIFIEKVKILETNEFKLGALEITYGEFKENISRIFTQKFENDYLEKKVEASIFTLDDGKKLYIKDIENITKEKLKNYQKRGIEISKGHGVLKKDITIEISDENYKSTFGAEKRVYSKRTRTVYFTDLEPVKTMHFKMYDFERIDDEWKISNIKESGVRIDRHYDRKTKTRKEITGKELREILVDTAFTPESNNKIQYVESFNLTLNME